MYSLHKGFLLSALLVASVMSLSIPGCSATPPKPSAETQAPAASAARDSMSGGASTADSAISGCGSCVGGGRTVSCDKATQKWNCTNKASTCSSTCQ